MQKSMFKKVLILGIIFLFVVPSFLNSNSTGIQFFYDRKEVPNLLSENSNLYTAKFENDSNSSKSFINFDDIIDYTSNEDLEDDCCGLIATGTCVKDNRSIFWKNRHWSETTPNRVIFYEENPPKYNYYGIGALSLNCQMGINEVGLSCGSFVANRPGYINNWTYISDETGGYPLKCIKFVLSNYNNVKDAAYYIAEHVNKSYNNGSNIGIISREQGVGAVVSIFNQNGTVYTNISWINNSWAAIDNGLFCEGLGNDRDHNGEIIKEIWDNITAPGSTYSIDGDNKVTWKDVCHRGAKNVYDQEKGVGTINTTDNISRNTSLSAFIAICGNDSYNGSANTAWVQLGRQALVGIFLPLGASYLEEKTDIPIEFRASEGMEGYMEPKVMYATEGEGFESQLYDCIKTREILEYANSNENHTFDEYERFMESLMTSKDDEEVKNRLKDFCDESMELSLFYYIKNLSYNGPVYNVDKNISYNSIQDAINHADSGNTINILSNSVFYEKIIINKSINLIGKNNDKTIIDGNGSGDTIKITADYVNITNITIQNSGSVGAPNYDAGIEIQSNYNNIYDNKIISNYCSIFLKGSNNRIQKNMITNNSYCIYISYSNNNTISNNIFTNNSWDGINIFGSNNTITGNNITNNEGYGILIKSDTFFNSYNNIIEGNNIKYNNNNGIYIDSSSNNTISWNNITDNNNYGIRIQGSSNTEINSNNITRNKYSIILVSSSDNSIVYGNDLEGVKLESSSNTIINYNDFLIDGINISGSKLSHWNTHAIVNNSVNGEPIYYYKDTKGTIVPFDAAQVILANSSNAILQGLKIENVSIGILLGFSPNNNIFGNSISNNTVYGIHLFESDYNDISNNNIINNNYGIHLSVSNLNNVYYNNFINNTQNAYDDFSNKWDNGYPSGGNYWADYTGVDTDGDGFGDTSYSIPGGSNQDNYPLMYIWNGSLPDLVYVDTDYSETTSGWGLDRFNKIQYAIYKVQENGTIYVFSGTYYENIVLNKRLNLVGENRDTTIIDGNNSGDVVYVYENSVNISRFTIRNSGNNNFYPYWDAGVEIHSNYNIISDNNIILNNNFGIYLKRSSNNTMLNNNASNNSNYGIYIEHYTSNKNHTLINNTVNDNGWDGIFVYGTNNTLINNTANNNYNRGIYAGGYNNIVFGNFVKNNQDNGIVVGEFSDIISNNVCNNYGTGISIYGSSNKIYSNLIYNNTYYGIRIDNGEKNNISYNNITSNYHGIELIQSSENNTISNNIINSNQWIGINIYQCNNNIVFENNVSYNDYGIALWSPAGNNTIYNNYFNNTNNAYDTGNNTWNVTKTSGTNIIGGSNIGGNFWSDYFGFDIDGDGLGDTDLPYDCEEKIQNGGDWLPLTFRQDEIPPEIVDNTLSKCYTGDSFTFNTSVFDNAFVSTVWIEYWYGSENHTNVSMNYVGGDFWEETIVIQNTLDILHYVIAANDTSNNWNNTDVKDITIYDNDKPVIIDYTPSNPEAGDPFTFNATVTDNIQVSNVWIEYWYDEGEHNNESMTNIADDIWEKTIIIGDTYEILHYVISAVDTSDNWINTDTKDLPIISNDPPNPPVITGPNSGKPGTSYDFTFNSIDPNGDNVRFIIDWGDTTSNTTDFVPSGTDITISHTWSLQGTYTITTKAEDSEGLIGLETTKTITIPRAKPKNFNFILLNWFFKHFPMLEKLLTLIRAG